MNLNKLNMENNTNIADILRDCPTGTKLYSPVFGNVTLAYVDVADRFPIGVKFDRDRMAGFLPDGRYVDVADAECQLFPSATMRDWDKFFKRGDVVCNADSHTYAVFRGWEDDQYLTFNAGYVWVNGGSNTFDRNVAAPTNTFTKCPTLADTVIKKIEEHYGGKINPGTLNIEIPAMPRLKPFDLVLVRDADDDFQEWRIDLFSHFNPDGKDRNYNCMTANWKYCIPYEGNERLLGTSDPYTEEGGAK